MSTTSKPRILTFKANGAIARGVAVKSSTVGDRLHVGPSSAKTDKSIGISQIATVSAEDNIEIALPGGGSKGLIGTGGCSFGDLLAPTTDGSLIVTTTPGDRYVAMAMEDGVAGDLASVEVVTGLI